MAEESIWPELERKYVSPMQEPMSAIPVTPPTTGISEPVGAGDIWPDIGSGKLWNVPRPKTGIPQFAIPEPKPPAPKTSEVGVLGALPKGIYAGVRERLPEMIGQAGQALGIPGAEAVTEFGRRGEEPKPPPKFTGSLAEWLYQTGEMVAPSLGPAVAAGAFLTGWPAAIAGGGIAAGLYGLSQYQQTKEAAQRAGVEPGAAPAVSGMIEAGGEALGTVALQRLLGPLAPTVVKGAKVSIRDVLRPTLRRALREFFGVTIPTEVGTEIGQQVGEAFVEEKAGIREPEYMKEALSVVPPTVGLSLLTLGMGRVKNRIDPSITAVEKTIQKPYTSLTDPTEIDTYSKRRLGAIEIVAKEFEKADPEFAKAFRAKAFSSVANNQEIPIEDDINLWLAGRPVSTETKPSIETVTKPKPLKVSAKGEEAYEKIFGKPTVETKVETPVEEVTKEAPVEEKVTKPQIKLTKELADLLVRRIDPTWEQADRPQEAYNTALAMFYRMTPEEQTQLVGMPIEQAEKIVASVKQKITERQKKIEEPGISKEPKETAPEEIPSARQVISQPGEPSTLGADLLYRQEDVPFDREDIEEALIGKLGWDQETIDRQLNALGKDGQRNVNRTPVSNQDLYSLYELRTRPDDVFSVSEDGRITLTPEKTKELEAARQQLPEAAKEEAARLEEAREPVTPVEEKVEEKPKEKELMDVDYLDDLLNQAKAAGDAGRIRIPKLSTEQQQYLVSKGAVFDTDRAGNPTLGYSQRQRQADLKAKVTGEKPKPPEEVKPKPKPRLYGLFKKDEKGRWIDQMPDVHLTKDKAVAFFQNAMLLGKGELRPITEKAEKAETPFKTEAQKVEEFIAAKQGAIKETGNLLDDAYNFGAKNPDTAVLPPRSQVEKEFNRKLQDKEWLAFQKEFRKGVKTGIKFKGKGVDTLAVILGKETGEKPKYKRVPGQAEQPVGQLPIGSKVIANGRPAILNDFNTDGTISVGFTDGKHPVMDDVPADKVNPLKPEYKVVFPHDKVGGVFVDWGKRIRSLLGKPIGRREFIEKFAREAKGATLKEPGSIVGVIAREMKEGKHWWDTYWGQMELSDLFGWLGAGLEDGVSHSHDFKGNEFEFRTGDFYRAMSETEIQGIGLDEAYNMPFKLFDAYWKNGADPATRKKLWALVQANKIEEASELMFYHMMETSGIPKKAITLATREMARRGKQEAEAEGHFWGGTAAIYENIRDGIERSGVTWDELDRPKAPEQRKSYLNKLAERLWDELAKKAPEVGKGAGTVTKEAIEKVGEKEVTRRKFLTLLKPEFKREELTPEEQEFVKQLMEYGVPFKEAVIEAKALNIPTMPEIPTKKVELKEEKKTILRREGAEVTTPKIEEAISKVESKEEKKKLQKKLRVPQRLALTREPEARVGRDVIDAALRVFQKQQPKIGTENAITYVNSLYKFGDEDRRQFEKEALTEAVHPTPKRITLPPAKKNPPAGTVPGYAIVEDGVVKEVYAGGGAPTDATNAVSGYVDADGRFYSTRAEALKGRSQAESVLERLKDHPQGIEKALSKAKTFMDSLPVKPLVWRIGSGVKKNLVDVRAYFHKGIDRDMLLKYHVEAQKRGVDFHWVVEGDMPIGEWRNQVEQARNEMPSSLNPNVDTFLVRWKGNDVEIVKDDKIVGKMKTEPNPGGGFHILDIDVAPEFENAGIADRLYETADKRFGEGKPELRRQERQERLGQAIINDLQWATGYHPLRGTDLLITSPFARRRFQMEMITRLKGMLPEQGEKVYESASKAIKNISGLINHIAEIDTTDPGSVTRLEQMAQALHGIYHRLAFSEASEIRKMIGMDEAGDKIMGDIIDWADKGGKGEIPIPGKAELRRAEAGIGMPAEEVRQIIDKRLGQLKYAPEVRIAETSEEWPEHIRIKGGIGVYDPATETIWIARDRMNSEADILKTVNHEAIGHYATKLLDSDFAKTFYERIYETYKDTLPDEMARLGYNFDFTTPEGIIEAVREKIAILSESGAKPQGVLAELYAWVREQLSKVFPTIKVTDADINRFIAKAQEKVMGYNETAANQQYYRQWKTAQAKAELREYRMAAPLPPTAPGAPGPFEASDPNAEQFFKEHKGFDQPPFLSGLKQAVVKAKQSLFEHFPELSNNILFGRVKDILRVAESIPERAVKWAQDQLEDIIRASGRPLTPQEMYGFSKIIVLDDIVKDQEAGLIDVDVQHQGGYNSFRDLAADLVRFKTNAGINPTTRDLQPLDPNNPSAIYKTMAKRQAVLDEWVKKLEDFGLIKPGLRDDPRYYHHQVMHYMNLKYYGPRVSSEDLRTHRKGWQYKRLGSDLAYNTEYAQSEFEVLAQIKSQIDTVEALQEVMKDQDIKKQVQAEAVARGLRADAWHMAMDAFPEYTTWQPVKGRYFYRTLGLREKIIDALFNGVMGERIKQNLPQGQITIDIPKDLRNVMAMGARKQEWVIRKELAKVLDDFRNFKPENPVLQVTDAILTSWKQWILMNPLRILKYNINNMSGDLDIVLAYDPKMVFGKTGLTKEFKDSVVELYNEIHAKHKLSQAQLEFLELARNFDVLQTGMTIKEVPDINESGIFKSLVGDKEKGQFRIPGLKWYWDNAKQYTNFRENVLRLTAFKYFLNKVNASPNGGVYAASRPEEVDPLNPGRNATPEEIRNLNERKAAKLARELIGDYGNLSPVGQWMRRHLIPFYSWMEINMPRYVRLMKNTTTEGMPPGRMRKIGIPLVGKTTSFAFKAMLMYGIISLWNRTFFPDEDDELKRAQRGQLHLILPPGRRADGSITSLRFQGALSDAFDWFGLEDLPDTYKDIVAGRKSVPQSIAEMALLSPTQKLFHAARPFEKAIGETLTGRTLYPEMLHPRPIRDKAEHLFKSFALDMPYRYASHWAGEAGIPVGKTPIGTIGRPTKGELADLFSLITYRSEAGEAAYYKAIQNVSDWLSKHGYEVPIVSPTQRSNALYYWKQSLRLKDRPLADKWLQEYVRLGGEKKDIKNSFKKSRPVSFVPIKLRRAYFGQLNEEDRRTFELATNWWAKTYGGGD